jgi:hypothetical protein
MRIARTKWYASLRRIAGNGVIDPGDGTGDEDRIHSGVDSESSVGEPVDRGSQQLLRHS